MPRSCFDLTRPVGLTNDRWALGLVVLSLHESFRICARAELHVNGIHHERHCVEGQYFDDLLPSSASVAARVRASVDRGRKHVCWNFVSQLKHIVTLIFFFNTADKK